MGVCGQLSAPRAARWWACREPLLCYFVTDTVDEVLNIIFSVYRVNSRVSADFGEDAQQVKEDTELEGEMYFCVGFVVMEWLQKNVPCAGLDVLIQKDVDGSMEEPHNKLVITPHLRNK